MPGPFYPQMDGRLGLEVGQVLKRLLEGILNGEIKTAGKNFLG